VPPGRRTVTTFMIVTEACLVEFADKGRRSTKAGRRAHPVQSRRVLFPHYIRNRRKLLHQEGRRSRVGCRL